MEIKVTEINAPLIRIMPGSNLGASAERHCESRLLAVCFSFYGPTNVKGKRTNNCGMDEKRVTLSCPNLFSPSALAAFAPYREKNRLLAVYCESKVSYPRTQHNDPNMPTTRPLRSSPFSLKLLSTYIHV